MTRITHETMLLSLSLRLQSLLPTQLMLLTLQLLNPPPSGNRLLAQVLDTCSTVMPHSSHWISETTSHSRLDISFSTTPIFKLNLSNHLQPSQELFLLIPLQTLQLLISLDSQTLLSHLSNTSFHNINSTSVQLITRSASKASSTQQSTASATRLATVWLQLFHCRRQSISTSSTGMSRLTTLLLWLKTCTVKFGSHPTLLSMIQETPPATSPGWTTSASNFSGQIITIPLLKNEHTLLNSIVAQLILTCQVKTSKALMTMPNMKILITRNKNLAQLGSMLTSKSLWTEQMQPTNQPLHHQYILQAVKDQD